MNSSQMLMMCVCDLLHASSRQVSQSSIFVLCCVALFLTVWQTSVFPPSSWQPRNVTLSFFSEKFHVDFGCQSEMLVKKLKKSCLPFIATIFWQTIGTLTSPAAGKKSILVISLSHPPTSFPSMTDGLQFYEKKKENCRHLHRCFQGHRRHRIEQPINHNRRRTKYAISMPCWNLIWVCLIDWIIEFRKYGKFIVADQSISSKGENKQKV